jgi:hypothetical protein
VVAIPARPAPSTRISALSSVFTAYRVQSVIYLHEIDLTKREYAGIEVAE